MKLIWHLNGLIKSALLLVTNINAFEVKQNTSWRCAPNIHVHVFKVRRRSLTVYLLESVNTQRPLEQNISQSS